MKKIFLLTACAICTWTVSAQRALERSHTLPGQPSSEVGAWKGLRVSYDKTFLHYNEDEYDYVIDEYSKNGFTVGYEQAFNVSNRLPLFFQTGLDLNFTRLNYEEEEYSENITVLGLSIPVNLVYGISLNDMLTLKPYTGFYLRADIWGQSKSSEIYDGEKSEEKVNLFSDDEEEMGEDAWKRVQAGWQIGMTLDISNFNVGIGYALDFNEIAEEIKTRKFEVKVGYNF